MTEEERINVLSPSNLQAAINFVNEQKAVCELDMAGAGICVTFIHRLLNDLIIRALDFDAAHFQMLAKRFDEICAEYESKGVPTAYRENTAEICRNSIAQSILAMKANNDATTCHNRRS